MSTNLEADFEASGTVRKMDAEEVLELLEGPNKTTFDDVMRAKAAASSDGVKGWFTIKDSQGRV